MRRRARVPGRRRDALAHLGRGAAVIALLSSLAAALLAALRPQASLVAENLALRQQLAVLRRAAPRPRLAGRPRILGRAFAHVVSMGRDGRAREAETVIGWHRRGSASGLAGLVVQAARFPSSSSSSCGWLATTRRGAGDESRASWPSWGTSSARTRSRDTCRDAGRGLDRPRRPGGRSFAVISGHARHRLPHRADRDVRRALRLLRAVARAPASAPRQRHRASVCRVGGAADDRGHRARRHCSTRHP